MYSNYGDLGAAVKSLLDDYQTTKSKHANVQSIGRFAVVLEYENVY